MGASFGLAVEPAEGAVCVARLRMLKEEGDVPLVRGRVKAALSDQFLVEGDEDQSLLTRPWLLNELS